MAVTIALGAKQNIYTHQRNAAIPSQINIHRAIFIERSLDVLVKSFGLIWV